MAFHSLINLKKSKFKNLVKKFSFFTLIKVNELTKKMHWSDQQLKVRKSIILHKLNSNN